MSSLTVLPLLVELAACAPRDPGGRAARVVGDSGALTGAEASADGTADFGQEDVVVHYLPADVGDLFGVEVGGDLDGDGVDDPAFRIQPSGTWNFVSGAVRGTVTVADTYLARISGWSDPVQYAGRFATGDLDGDGDVDAVVAREDGLVVLDGPLAGEVDVADGRLVVAADLSILPGNSQAEIRLIDYDLDGTLELVFAWPRLVEGHATPTPEAWVFDGPFDALRTLADARLHVVSELYYAMSDVPGDERVCLPDAIPAPLGDVDGDGVGELAIAPSGSCGLDLWIASGDVAGEAVLGVGGIPLEVEAPIGSFRTDNLGDLDGDGRADLLVGTVDTYGVASGLPAAPIAPETNAASLRLTLDQEAYGGVFPDIDGDGRDEIFTTNALTLDGAIFSGAARGVTGQDVSPLFYWYLHGSPLAYVWGAAEGPVGINASSDSAGYVGVQIMASN